MSWFGVTPWPCGPASVDDGRVCDNGKGQGIMTAGYFAAQQRHAAAKAFWHAQEDDVAIVNQLRAQARLPQIAHDTRPASTDESALESRPRHPAEARHCPAGTHGQPRIRAASRRSEAGLIGRIVFLK